MKNRWMTFTDARNFARSLNLKSWNEWKDYCKYNRPSNIPYEPKNTYKDEWINYYDWLGKEKLFSEVSRKYSINEDFFKVWSHDMAYILGLWWADGNIFNNVFSICLHKKDMYLLEEISGKMGYSGKLYRGNKKNIYRLDISSKEIVKDIKLLGGTERKSLTIGFPDVPIEYLHDFIRGVWDGDGCVSNTKRGVISSICSGSEEFIKNMYICLKNNNIVGSLRKDNRITKEICGNSISINSTLYTIGISKNNTIKLRKYMYKNKNEIRMLRKYKIFCMAGEIKIIKNGFMEYEGARNIVKKLNLKSHKDWIKYCKLGMRPFNIPYSPDRTYKNKGWVSWEEWLGYGKEKVKGEKKCV